MIGTAAELQTLSNRVAAGVTYEGKYFKLTNDIDTDIEIWIFLYAHMRGG